MLLLFPFLALGYVGLALAASYWGARWAGQRFRSRTAAVVGFAVVLTSFLGDEVYGYWHWQRLCETKGGSRVYERVPVAGFFIDGPISEGVAREHLKKSRMHKQRPVYSFVEGVESGQAYRFTAVGDDDDPFAIKKVTVDTIASQYGYVVNPRVEYPGRVWAMEATVYDMTSKEVIAVSRSLGYKGGAVMRLLRGITGANFEGSASYCGTGAAPLVQQAIPPSLPRTN